ncbi:hypothetical protein V2J09_010782 [Rumex salicifolius]
MASVSTIQRSSPCYRRSSLFSGLPSRLRSPLYVALPPLPFRGAVISFARRRSGQNRPISPPPNNKKKKKQGKKDHGLEDGLGEDAFEALFQQLEEDLKNDESLDDSDDDFTEEDLAMLEKELEEVLAVDEDLSDLLNPTVNEAEGGVVSTDGVEETEEYAEEDVDEEEIEPPVKLKGWQLRRVAYALKKGRRKVSIKDLAAEVCLDRAVVLELLREPPPELLLLSAALPDIPEQTVSVSDSEFKDSHSAESVHSDPSEVAPDSSNSETDMKTPIHVLQRGWSAQKRFKKVHLETLERVYRRSRRPTNAIISSIVLVTNLPKKRIVKWFEDKRLADGIPEQRRPYQRSDSEPAYVRFSNIRDSVDSS